MAWVVLTVIAAIIVGACVITAIMAKPTPADQRDRYNDEPPTRAIALGIGGVVAVCWIILSAAMSVHTVGQRQVGIVYNFSGTITGKVDPGVATTMPWQHIKKENVGLQREDFALDAENSAVSKDQQAVFAHFTVNYQVDPEKVVDLFKRVGPAWKQTLLDSRALQDFKEVTAGFTAQEITTKRPQLREQTRTALERELAQYDIKVLDVFVTNLGYSKAYEDAIDAKNRQVQQSLQAEAKVEQAKAEADQQIQKARGEATANKLISNSCSDRCIRLRAIEKLNPAVQVVYVPTGSSFLIPQVASGK